jgi:hypothetical protein
MAGLGPHTSPRETFCGSTDPQWYPCTLTAGSNIVITGMPGYQVKVYAVFLGAATATTAIFQDGVTPFSGAIPFSGLAFDDERKPMICSVGNNFVITCGGSAAGMVFANIN